MSTTTTANPAVSLDINRRNQTQLSNSGYGTAAERAGGTRSNKKQKRSEDQGIGCVNESSDPKDAITELLGDVNTTPVMSRNLDLYQGYPRSMTGIPYAIQGIVHFLLLFTRSLAPCSSAGRAPQTCVPQYPFLCWLWVQISLFIFFLTLGTATVINVEVGEYLAKFQDPLKSILSTNIHRESRVIITRKYVVGGRAMITPEHAPARTVAIQEDTREVDLTRYGGDIEMNLCVQPVLIDNIFVISICFVVLLIFSVDFSTETFSFALRTPSRSWT